MGNSISLCQNDISQPEGRDPSNQITPFFCFIIVLCFKYVLLYAKIHNEIRQSIYKSPPWSTKFRHWTRLTCVFYFAGMTYIRSIPIDLFRGMNSASESSTLSTISQVCHTITTASLKITWFPWWFSYLLLLLSVLSSIHIYWKNITIVPSRYMIKDLLHAETILLPSSVRKIKAGWI